MFKILTFCIIGLLLVKSFESQTASVAPLWSKCGGKDWKGPTKCPEKAICKVTDAWFSQCVPDDGSVQTTAATVKPASLTTKPLATTAKPNIITSKLVITTTLPTKAPQTTLAGNNALITEEEFMNAVTSNGYPRPTSAQYKSYSSQLQSAGGITTKREAAMFLAQVMHESGGLKYKSELICATDGCPNHYEITPGIGIPGKRYFGRGYIQLTWDYNYKAASKDLYNDDRLIKNPEIVATDEQVSWATAFWFWKANVGTDSQVKAGKFGASTNRINGALECRGANLDKARKRFDYYKKVLIAFHVTETPIENGCYN